MIERLALVIVLAIFCGATYYGLRSLHIRRMKPAHAGAAAPTLLYFRGDSCAVCPAQTRAIDQLASLWPDSLQIERIDAEHDMETAARYSVFTLPTTIWIDGDGRVRQVNYGLADADKLGRQLSLLAAIKLDQTPSVLNSKSAQSA
ncbi:MAG: thioredoxin family protein [Anaerolineae bacterium]|uniref:thioredoxin family protein n=1 Tax=Promineifilum sp. TaxID=2664178 RepID=UPI001D3AA87F|nr:thioredoxin family protein [Anaerolineales bacterium]MCB8935688.1 thioredoxin family protein [Promineifilum sp.]MCO5181958.1 thioredoxin family protein [Promineifilum sp.]MCW5846971.1 thioredoxin family protein [Anaerolineae bacterium]